MMEWTEEKCLNLIELYQNSPVLWEPSDPNYYKKNLKVDAWENIGQAMGMPGESCKNKMITLLASYRREKMKIKSSHGTGKGTSEIYDSKWFAFQAMSFLWNRDAPRKRRLNTVINDIETGNGEETEVMQEPPNKSARPPEVMPEPPNKSTRPDPKLQLLKEAFGILKSASSKASRNNIQNEEIKSFLEFVGSKMMKYSEHTKNVVQQGICDLIFKADSRCFDENSYCHPACSTQTATRGYYTYTTTSRNTGQVNSGHSSPDQQSPSEPLPYQLSPGQPASDRVAKYQRYDTQPDNVGHYTYPSALINTGQVCSGHSSSDQPSPSEPLPDQLSPGPVASGPLSPVESEPFDMRDFV